MKTATLLALALSTTILAPIAFAAGKPARTSDQVSGVGEFWIGYNFLNEGTAATVVDDDSYLGLGGNLRVNVPAGGSLNLQFDLASETEFVDDSNDNYTGSVLGGAHVSYREVNQWLLGGFIGVGNGYNADDDTVNTWLIGAEGQYYLPDWTFYGQLGYLDGSQVSPVANEAFRDAYFGRGVARFFLDSNVKLEGELSYASGESGTVASDMDVWGWGLKYERSINSMDANFFVGYQGNLYSADETGGDGNDELTEHVVKLGLNFAFGIEGQKYVDRNGATLDLPMVTRWSSYAVDVLD